VADQRSIGICCHIYFEMMGCISLVIGGVFCHGQLRYYRTRLQLRDDFTGYSVG
jgi:hypothetical protein